MQTSPLHVPEYEACPRLAGGGTQSVACRIFYVGIPGYMYLVSNMGRVYYICMTDYDRFSKNLCGSQETCRVFFCGCLVYPDGTGPTGGEGVLVIVKMLPTELPGKTAT